MEVRLLEIAQIELYETVDYYNSQSPGLGDEFLLEFIKTTDRIIQFPKAWHPYTKTTRRCQLKRFPYGIIYQIFKSYILIIAIANLHRKPEYWHDRIIK